MFNIQFPDKTGFRLRWNRLVRVGYWDLEFWFYNAGSELLQPYGVIINFDVSLLTSGIQLKFGILYVKCFKPFIQNRVKKP